MSAADGAAQRDETRRGTLYGAAAYGIWGAFPLYFHALKPAGPFEILAHRILWSFLFCAAILLLRRDLAWLRSLLADRRRMGVVTAAGILLAINWVVYVLAVLSGRTYEAALGYFINPLVTVALGVGLLGERLRPLQQAALAVGAIAALYLVVAGGIFPWISITLALSFGLYGLLKKRLGVSMDALHSLTAETVALVPVAVIVLVLVARRGALTFGSAGIPHALALASAGVVTAIPLLLFAAAARRVPLVTIGLLQFATPLLQLLAGVLILREHVSPALWVGFAIVWVALAILATDMVRQSRSARA